MNQSELPAPRPVPAAPLPDAPANAVTRIGNFNILRLPCGNDDSALQGLACAQSKLDTSPQEQLALLHQKARLLLQAIERHETTHKKKSLVSVEATEARKAKLRAFLQQVEAYGAAKEVALQGQVAIKSGSKMDATRVSAQSLARKNLASGREKPEGPPQVHLQRGLTLDARQLADRKLVAVVKRLREAEEAVGDPAVFGEERAAETVREELSSLRLLERQSVQEAVDKLAFVHRDFSRFHQEFKKQFLQQEQKKEMLVQLEEFLREFQEERISQIPAEVLEAVETVEANSALLTRLAKTVEDCKAANGLCATTGRTAEENGEVLAALRETMAANERVVEGNKALRK